MRLPPIIQGGMGIAVSNWSLARAVSSAGQLGVVSGTAIDSVLVRRLQDGDPCGSVRRAMSRFPLPDVTAHVMRRFFNADGRVPGEPYRLLPMYRQRMAPLRQQITMLASFVEVTLAKEGHEGLVGINLLTKLQMPNLPTLYGAMLAGVNVVLMGAGIPREIPGALDAMSRHETATLKFDVEGLPAGTTEYLTFDPRAHNEAASEPLERPLFFPIVSAASLAHNLARKSNGRVDGFVVEGPTAGGHNAPPRGTMRLSESGEPIYGERDAVDLAAMREIGLPFWLAGGSGSPDGLDAALTAGATGIQVGTLFAYTEEAGFTREIQRTVIEAAAAERLTVRTDPRASPTGYPFKVAMVDAQPVLHSIRTRVCDLGYLRTAVRNDAGKIIYRCPSEPIDDYAKKGGAEGDTADRQCLCNALMSCIGMGQEREGYVEPPIVTSGDDVQYLNRFLQGRDSYRAADVIAYLTRTALVPA
ncbi:MAG: nitronate monooxygenase [Gemmatimonadaceae bacterium]|nr:nitronate monooxygenase [Gemmatimonadaceae bacterium]